MNAKKITIGTKPSARPQQPATSDAWVDDRKAETEATKRLTIDIPVSLHAKIKSSCAMRGTKMVDEITALLEEKFQ